MKAKNSIILAISVVVFLSFVLVMDYSNKTHDDETGFATNLPDMQTASTTDMAALNTRLVSFYTGVGASSADPYVAAELNAIRIKGSGASNTMNPDGSWSTIDYEGTDSTVHNHFSRVLEMAIAYSTPGQSQYKSATLKSNIEKSLLYLNDVQILQNCTYPYTGKPGCPANVGIYFGVYIPQRLGKALVLMKGEISQESYDAGLKVMNANTRSLSTTSRSNYNTALIMVNTYLAILNDDESKMNTVRQAVNNLATPGSYMSSTAHAGSEGLKPDYSYLDHGATLYIKGYGDVSFGNQISEYIYVTSGTPYAPSDAAVEHFANFVADGISMTLNDEYYDISATGRNGVVKLSVETGRMNLILMSDVPSERQEEITAAAKKYLEAYEGTFTISEAKLISQIKNSPIAARWPSAHRYYPFADYTIHRTPQFYMSVKTLSERTQTSDMVNSENKLGALGTDGRMHLTLVGDEYGANNILPTMDWERLPGVTVEKKPNVAVLKGQPVAGVDGPSGAGWPGKRSFVGGVSDGVDGVSVMDFQSVFTNLSARKSWFFFGDYAVFVTTDIKDNSGYTVESIIDQRPLISAATPMYVNGVEQPNTIGWSATLSEVNWISANNIIH